MVFSRAGHLPVLRRYFRARLGPDFETGYLAFEDNDLALEWCENKWLDQRLPPLTTADATPIESYELLQGLTPQEIHIVAALFEHRSYRQDQVMVDIGAPANEVFLIHRGSASITLPLPNGTQRRLGLFSPGMCFGEVAMLDGAPRSAVVKAETDVECHLLKRNDFESLEQGHPRIKITLLRNMALGIARLLRKSTREAGVFDY
jgi:glutaminase